MNDESITRRRILFVAESVTLAHFARCVTLAKMLSPERYEVFLASDPRYLSLVPEPRPFAFRPIKSILPAQFNEALAEGKPVYDAGTLSAYVEDDLELLRATQPDLVIGDFRLSLAVSAPKVGVPYASIINAYWSPFARVHYPVPDLPFVRFLGLAAAQRLFDLVRPMAFALHTRPMNWVRRQHGLPSLGNDLRQVYSWADHVLYPDIPEAVDMAPLPSNHHFIGPALWSATAELPDWWTELPSEKPIVYLTLGSSGRGDLLPLVLEALAGMPVTVIASTAGNIDVTRWPANAYLADFLPGDEATALSQLVICNGGNLTTYQALSAAVPVIGVTTNMDQMLNMQMLERFGAGEALRASQLTVRNLRDVVEMALGDPQMMEAAQRCARQFSTSQTKINFTGCVAAILN